MTVPSMNHIMDWTRNIEFDVRFLYFLKSRLHIYIYNTHIICLKVKSTNNIKVNVVSKKQSYFSNISDFFWK